MSKPYESWVTLEVPVTVKVLIYPGDPGVRTFSNGDPGYPPTPPEFEFSEAWIGDDHGPWKEDAKNSRVAMTLAEVLREKVEEATGYDEKGEDMPLFEDTEEDEC